jgi:DNA-binding NarL/FixJ family response regulator
LGGPGLIQQLRRACPRAEILVYTDIAQEKLAFEMLRHGAKGFIFKTDPDRHFVAALDALLERRPFFSKSISEALLNQFLRSDSVPVHRILTFRESEIVQLITEGYSNKRIAEKLSISVKTVETHRASTMSKLKIRTTADLVRYAVRNHIIQA